ncbi:CatA-like O-acetyltransferase [Sphingobacterium hungaricum]
MKIVNKVDISSWKRNEHYHFFRKFNQPFFGITTLINCTEAYAYCKSYKVSFLEYYLHKSLLAVNQIREFRYRIQGDEIHEYKQISGSITVLRLDETFGFAYFDFHTDFKSFALGIRSAIQQEKMAKGLMVKDDQNDIIHYSILPDIQFSGLQHAQMLCTGDSIPKLVFGELIFNNKQVALPISIHVHHALCGGIHVSKFLNLFQNLMQII